jgi:hypothetical protein
MKAAERRADKWFTAMGVAQTEIDALATLRPRVLSKIVREALDFYYDHTLDGRVRKAREEWEREAQQALDQQLGPDVLDRIRDEAEAQLEELEEQVDALNDALRIDLGGITLPEFVPPEPEDREYGLPCPLIDSDDDYAEASRRLIAHKAYEVGP